MKKAMIITIGTGSGVDSGIAFSVRQQNPDLICFIYSKESEKTLDAVISKISRTREDVTLWNFNEVNDVQVLYQEYSKYIREILNKGYNQDEIVADYTSGTKSMSAALVSAAIAMEIGTLSYVYGQRDNQGRVITDTERISPLSPNAILTEQKLKLFKVLFNQYQFDSSLQLLNNSKIYPVFKPTADFYINLAKAYGNWDRFNFKSASEIMNSIDLDIAQQFQMKSIITDHKRILHQLKTADNNKELTESDLADLFSNAMRRFNEGKYDDCVARLYRLVEMVAQIEFAKEFRVSTDRVPVQMLPESIKKRVDANKDNQQIELGLLDTFQILHEQSANSRAKMFFNRLADFKKLLFVRNHSRLAHGQRPIARETCEDLISFIGDVFKIEEKIKFPCLK